MQFFLSRHGQTQDKMGSNKELQKIDCPMCDWSKKRGFENHLIQAHSTTAKELWDKFNGPGICRCGCKKETSWIDWKRGYSDFIKGHNASIYSAYDKEIADKLAKTRGNNWRGEPGWSKGLTKETDERILNRARRTSESRRDAFAAGQLTVWNTGETKETDHRIAAMSDTIKDDFKSGRRSQWHLGKTEKTDRRLAIKNENLRKRYENGELNPWHKGKTKAEDARISKAWDKRDPISEYSHIRWSNDDIEKQLQNNIQLRLERIENYKNDRTPSLYVNCTSCSFYEKGKTK
jgi:hypothetical protein